MWRKAFLVFLALVIVLPILASDVQLGLKVMQPRLILGEPLHVVITVQNTSGQTLDLPFEPILAGENPAVLVGLPGAGLVASPTGTPLACEASGTTITAAFPWKMGGDFDIVVPAGQTVSFEEILWLPVPVRSKAGSYALVAHYEAQGRHLGQRGGIVGQPNDAYYGCNQCWKGTADSAPAMITVEAPTGVDAAAYKAFGGNPLGHPAELLQDFPASTYAGYALLDPGGQCIPDPRVFLVNLLVNDETAQRWPQTTDQMTSEKRKALEDDKARADQLSAYLKARPGFTMADALKVELAGRLAALGCFQEVQAVCAEITARDAASLESAKAKMLLDYLVKKGYLKAAQ